MSRRSWLLVCLLGAVVGVSLLVMNLVLARVEEDQLFDLEQRLRVSQAVWNLSR